MLHYRKRELHKLRSVLHSGHCAGHLALPFIHLHVLSVLPLVVVPPQCHLWVVAPIRGGERVHTRLGGRAAAPRELPARNATGRGGSGLLGEGLGEPVSEESELGVGGRQVRLHAIDARLEGAHHLRRLARALLLTGLRRRREGEDPKPARLVAGGVLVAQQALALAQHPLRRSQHLPRPARTLRAATATATALCVAALAAGAKLL